MMIVANASNAATVQSWLFLYSTGGGGVRGGWGKGGGGRHHQQVFPYVNSRLYWYISFVYVSPFIWRTERLTDKRIEERPIDIRIKYWLIYLLTSENNMALLY